MDTAKILSELRSERQRIDRAITVLEALDSAVGTTRQTTSELAPKTRGRRMSPAARKRMSDAQRKRWADKRKTGTPPVIVKNAATKKAPATGGLTPAGRKRLSELAKARWAAKKRAAAKA